MAWRWSCTACASASRGSSACTTSMHTCHGTQLVAVWEQLVELHCLRVCKQRLLCLPATVRVLCHCASQPWARFYGSCGLTGVYQQACIMLCAAPWVSWHGRGSGGHLWAAHQEMGHRQPEQQAPQAAGGPMPTLAQLNATFCSLDMLYGVLTQHLRHSSNCISHGGRHGDRHPARTSGAAAAGCCSGWQRRRL